MPGRLHVAGDATRCHIAQRLVHRIAKRQAVGDLREHREIQLARAQLALFERRIARIGTGLAEEQGGVGPAQPVVGHEREMLDADLEAVLELLRADAALDRIERNRLQLVAQRGAHLLERHIGHAASDLAASHIDPGTHRALAFAHGERAEVGIFIQARHIAVGQIDKDLAAPGLPVAACGRPDRLAELAAHRKTLAPAFGRRGIEPHAVPPCAVAQHQIDVGEFERRRFAQLVGPAHLAVQDDDFALREQPVGRRVVVAARAAGDRQTRHVKLPGFVAPHVELRRLDVELIEPPAQKRARRHGHHHLRQAQCLTAHGVKQLDVGQLQRGYQTLALRGQTADSHGYPQGLLGLGLYLLTEFSDTRHNEAVQQAPGDSDQQPERKQQPQRPSREPCKKMQQA